MTDDLVLEEQLVGVEDIDCLEELGLFVEKSFVVLSQSLNNPLESLFLESKLFVDYCKGLVLCRISSLCDVVEVLSCGAALRLRRGIGTRSAAEESCEESRLHCG